MISLHNMLPFQLTKDSPYLALSGELWSVFYEFFNRNWSCYKGFLLYNAGWCLVPLGVAKPSASMALIFHALQFTWNAQDLLPPNDTSIDTYNQQPRTVSHSNSSDSLLPSPPSAWRLRTHILASSFYNGHTLQYVYYIVAEVISDLRDK